MDEENDPRSESANERTFYENIGTWEPYDLEDGLSGAAPTPPQFSVIAGGGPAGWHDCPAAFHLTGATFSFCDGHAEFHQWVDPTTLWLANYTGTDKASQASRVGVWSNCQDDLYWTYTHIATPLWP